MTELIVIVPTLSRPDNARRLAQAFATLCSADTRLIFVVDDDDPKLAEYSDVEQSCMWTDLQVEIRMAGPWQPMVPKLNQMATEVADQSFAVAFMGDDHLPRTPGWDSEILAALRELGTGIVYGDDLVHGEKLCTSWAMTSDIVQALGRMVPAPVEHMYCDNAVMDLAKQADCLRYLPDVVIEHMHPIVGKAQWDASYVRVNQAAQYYKDDRAYQMWVANGLSDDVAKVKALQRE